MTSQIHALKSFIKVHLPNSKSKENVIFLYVCVLCELLLRFDVA